MQKYLVIFQPYEIDKFLTEIILAHDIIDAAIIFQRNNNDATIIQLTKII